MCPEGPLDLAESQAYRRKQRLLQAAAFWGYGVSSPALALAAGPHPVERRGPDRTVSASKAREALHSSPSPWPQLTCRAILAVMGDAPRGHSSASQRTAPRAAATASRNRRPSHGSPPLPGCQKRSLLPSVLSKTASRAASSRESLPAWAEPCLWERGTARQTDVALQASGHVAWVPPPSPPLSLWFS